ncbi:hypothetical protein BASA81_000251 [Batrachochytrium salamandrivorans]|nr:hypothetical protein BASA81_000251 [Batrachochytrium salamandrivorans]
MRQVLAVVLALGAVSADTLTDTLKLRLNQQMEVLAPLQCSNIQQQLCPTGVPTPSVTFSPTVTKVTGETDACCKANYLQCQLQLNQMLYRELATYVIPVEQGNSEEECPLVSSDCTCQLALAAEKSFEFNACPTPPDCCPTCECHGDPHCASFIKTIPSAIWAICDDRSATCVHGPTTCANTMYDGQACAWDGQAGLCKQAPGTKKAQMDMYSKMYRPAFGSNHDLTNFAITLDLTTYGSISTVTIVDGSLTFIFSTSANSCSGTSRFPIYNNVVNVFGLPSGVYVQLQCMSTGNGNNHPRRWDVNFVKDPWFLPTMAAPIPGQSFTGFCPTGKILENKDPATSTCRIVDRQIANYYGCKANAAMGTCKAQFCDKMASKLIFPPQFSGSATKACAAYLNAGDTNFLIAACTVSKLHTGSKADVAECVQDDQCKKCMDDMGDFPEQVNTILSATRELATAAPTTACPPDLVAQGLKRKSLTIGSGLQIEAQNNATLAWTPVFALLDEEITNCGVCGNPLKLTSQTSGALALLAAGTYRIRQGIALDTDQSQKLCTGALGLNATVKFYNPFANGGAVSQTFGNLYNSGSLICSPTVYKKCPLNYQCCVWDKATSRFAWEECMATNHGGAAKYPNCGD